MKILHTEASKGWGGQEIRIFKEAHAFAEKGWEISFATAPNAELASKAKGKGFFVEEIEMKWKSAFQAVFKLMRLIRSRSIDVVVTHSSMDSWLAGIAAKLTGTPVIRLRHLSTPIKKGLNSRILYNFLANYTVTTCQSIAEVIRKQANLTEERCFSVPTGINADSIQLSPDQITQFRKQWNIKETDFVVGTLCVMRSWKGIADLLKAAHILKEESSVKWLIVGGGPAESYFKDIAKSLELHASVIFTGHLENPYPSLAAMDVFALLSTANEGVSQASLQASILKKPLITTNIGGLGEVCIPSKNGFIVPVNSPEIVSDAVQKLLKDPSTRQKYGEWGCQYVKEKFSFDWTLDTMEKLYQSLLFK